jgi:ABC-type uncharacterized transport system auxiliary subunit
MANITRIAGGRMVRLFAVVAFTLTLAACDKCIMPTWNPSRTPGPPTSCHDDAPVK